MIEWEIRVSQYEHKFVTIDEDVKVGALKNLLPDGLYEGRFQGFTKDFATLRQEITNYINDPRLSLNVKSGTLQANLGEVETDTKEKDEHDPMKMLSDHLESLNLFFKGAKGKGGKTGKGEVWAGKGGKGWNQQWGAQWSPHDGGKGKGRGKLEGTPSRRCFACGGEGHIARDCANNRSLNQWKGKGKGINNLDEETSQEEHGCHGEEVPWIGLVAHEPEDEDESDDWKVQQKKKKNKGVQNNGNLTSCTTRTMMSTKMNVMNVDTHDRSCCRNHQ